jgi:hypothetical protein
MKAEFYAEGERYAARLGAEIERGKEAGEVGVVTDCNLAALRPDTSRATATAIGAV